MFIDQNSRRWVLVGQMKGATYVEKIPKCPDPNAVVFDPFLNAQLDGIWIFGLKCGKICVVSKRTPIYTGGTLSIGTWAMTNGILCEQFAMASSISIDGLTYSYDGIRKGTILIASKDRINPLCVPELRDIAKIMPRLNYKEYREVIRLLLNTDMTDVYEIRRCLVEIAPRKDRRVLLVDKLFDKARIVVLNDSLCSMIGETHQATWKKQSVHDIGKLNINGITVECDFPGEVIHHGIAYHIENDPAVRDFMCKVGLNFQHMNLAYKLACADVSYNDFELFS